MRSSHAYWLLLGIASVSACKEPFCVEGVIGSGANASKYEQYDCSHYAGTGSVIHVHLGGSKATGGATASGGSGVGGDATGGVSEAGGADATGGVPSEGGTEATGGVPEAGGTSSGEGGAPATGGSAATGGSPPVAWCPDGGVNCLMVNQLGGLLSQNVYCGQESALYGKYDVVNMCSCDVVLKSVYVRTDTASAIRSATLAFSSGTISFSAEFDILQSDTWHEWTSGYVIASNATYAVDLTGTICKEGQDPPAIGSYVRMAFDGVRVLLPGGGVSDPILLASSYGVSHTVVAAP